MRDIAGPPVFDGPFDALTNKDDTPMPVPPDVPLLTWHPLAPNDLPSIGQPVLLRLKNRKEIAKPQNAAFGTMDVGTLLRPGFRYGYTVAVLRYMQDGFGNLFPLEFVAYDFKQGGGSPGTADLLGFDLRTRYVLSEVDAWLVLE